MAEKEVRERTSTSQLIWHFLKLGSTAQRVEKEILKKQKDLLTAKTENLKAEKDVAKLYSDAIEAMGIYAPKEEDDYDE